MATKKEESNVKNVRSQTPWGGLDVPDQKLHAIGAQVVTRKNQYYSSASYDWYTKRVDRLNAVINQEVPQNTNVNARVKIIRGMTRAAYDYYNFRTIDLFDVPNLAQVQADISNEVNKQMADDLTVYVNSILNSGNKWYKRHLYKRFRYLPDYGWSPAFDYYHKSNSWAVRAITESALPGLETMKITAEQDDYQSGPRSMIIDPKNWFGDAYNPIDDSVYEGYIKRMYVKDIDVAIGMTDDKGKDIYNVDVLKKYKGDILKGAKYPDQYRNQADSPANAPSPGNKDTYNTPGFIDCVVYQGTLDYIGEEEDGNTYYVEVLTTGEVVRLQEAPLDRGRLFNHFQTHPMRNNPFSRSWLDSMYDMQVMSDIISSSMLENLQDGQHRFWAYDEGALVNPDDFESPEGLNVLLRLTGPNALLPRLLNDGQSGNFRDALSALEWLGRENESFGVSLQQLGAVGQSTAKTATQSRITSSADALKYRAPIKCFSTEGIIPQINNITLLSIVNDSERVRKVHSPDGREVKITPEHINFYIHGCHVNLYETITRDYDDLSARINNWVQMAQGITQLKDPAPFIKVVRASAKFGGIPQDVIDDALPKPEPIDANNPDQGQATQQMQQQLQELQGQLQQAQQQMQSMASEYELKVTKLKLEEQKLGLDAQRVEIERGKVRADTAIKAADVASRIPQQELRDSEKDSLYRSFTPPKGAE